LFSFIAPWFAFGIMEADSLTFTRLDEATVGRAAPIMAAAFDDDCKRFHGVDRGGPPGYDDGSFLAKWGLQSCAEACAIWLGERLIGVYIVWWRHDESQLGTIFIDPEVQNLGVGKKVWRHIEESYPTESWILTTPMWSVRNHHFYERCGFQKAGIDGDQVVFRKRRHAGGAAGVK
jgi:GNAT superfamily N-acetyltransferase